MENKMGDKSNIVLIILDADICISVVRDGLNISKFSKIILSDVVEFQIEQNADAKDVDAFLKANKDRIEIQPTSFRELLEAAKKDSNIAMSLPRDMCLLSTYGLVNKILHEEPTAVVLISDEWLEKNYVRQSFVRLMSLHEFRVAINN